MENKRISSLMIILCTLLLCIPKITSAQLLTDGVSHPSIFTQYFALFIIFGLPLLGMALIFVIIYTIVSKIKSKSSNNEPGLKHQKDSQTFVISILLTLLIVGSGSFLWKQISESRYLNEENNFLETQNEKLTTENERLKQELAELKKQSP